MKQQLNHFSFQSKSGSNQKPLRKTISQFILVGVFSLACVSQSTFSQELSPEGLYYYDGNRKIALEVEEGVVAEFGTPYNPSNRSARSVIQSADKEATFLKSHGNLNLWRTSGKQSTANLSKSLNQGSKNSVSPVFRQAKSSTIMALPGNILVEFEPSYSEKQIEVLLAGKGLRSARKFDIPGKNLYEIETPSGSASLNLANSLYGTPSVISSTPNWWREAVAK